jgi:hypothetical protein
MEVQMHKLPGAAAFPAEDREKRSADHELKSFLAAYCLRFYFLIGLLMSGSSLVFFCHDSIARFLILLTRYSRLHGDRARGSIF